MVLNRGSDQRMQVPTADTKSTASDLHASLSGLLNAGMARIAFVQSHIAVDSRIVVSVHVGCSVYQLEIARSSSRERDVSCCVSCSNSRRA